MLRRVVEVAELQPRKEATCGGACRSPVLARKAIPHDCQLLLSHLFTSDVARFFLLAEWSRLGP